MTTPMFPPPAAPPPPAPPVVVQEAPRKQVTKRQGGISLTRLLVAVCTCGLSLPFLGVRRVKRTTTRTR